MRSCMRIVNDNDGIALVPMFNGYRHVGDLIQLEHLAPEENKNVAVRFLSSLMNFARMDSVQDHDMDSYVATMEHWLKKDK